MNIEQFNFKLPEELIAKYPTKNRSGSRLIHMLTNGDIEHLYFNNIIDIIESNSLLIFNDTRVIPARIYAQKETGGKVEILVERTLENNLFLAHVKSNKKLKKESILELGKDKIPNSEYKCKVIGRKDQLFILELLSEKTLFSILEEIGHVPLPPYINRHDEKLDLERYQTIYNKTPGAVAAPTAGLHFDDNILKKLECKNIEVCFVTLHVSSGTFLPVKVDNIKDHVMHSEYVEVSDNTCKKIIEAYKQKRQIVAIGTTSVRSIESAARKAIEENSNDVIVPFYGDTNIFLYPGQPIYIIDTLITNFHLPKSTLIMLVASFIGLENTIKLYNSAINNKYRFFSYGDSSIIHNLNKVKYK